MFSKAQVAALVGALASFSTAAPAVQQAKRADPLLEGPYPGDSGVASRKMNLVSLGADAQDLSVALIEHGAALASDPTQNTIDDNNIGLKYATHDASYGDSANFGLFNLNWYMMRTAPCAGFANQHPGDWKNGAAINDDVPRAIACMKATRDHFGSNWFGVQRSGQSMCNTGSIQLYTNAVNTIKDFNWANRNASQWESYNVSYQGSC